MLEQHDSEVERVLDLAEDPGGGGEAGRRGIAVTITCCAPSGEAGTGRAEKGAQLARR